MPLILLLSQTIEQADQVIDEPCRKVVRSDCVPKRDEAVLEGDEGSSTKLNRVEHHSQPHLLLAERSEES